MQKIGFTTTIPIEIIHAANFSGVDLNNIFITAPEPSKLIESAEKRGLPTTLCSWIKGIYAVLQERTDIETVIAVVSGDCSNTLPLVDLLRSEGREVISFAYPFDRNKELLTFEIERLMKRFAVTQNDVKESTIYLDSIRQKADLIDLMTWKDNKVTGFENHEYLINFSDFEGSPDVFKTKLDSFIDEIQNRKPLTDFIPLGLVGVPPIFSDFYDFLEEKQARIIFNETQRQFTFPSRLSDYIERYLDYTYPYSLLFRLEDIKRQIKQRGIKGIIHYTQSFCHHQMDHILLKENLSIPVLMLEGDRPLGLDGRTRIRLESFIEMLN